MRIVFAAAAAVDDEADFLVVGSRQLSLTPNSEAIHLIAPIHAACACNRS